MSALYGTLVSQTVHYGVMAMFITVVYLAIVVGAGAFAGGGMTNEPNAMHSLLATAAVAVAFGPVRARAERFANRLAYGRRATPYELLSGFTQRMAGALSADEILPRAAEAIAKGAGAERARVRVRLTGAAPAWGTAWWPPVAGETPAVLTADLVTEQRFDHVVPVHHNGRLVGDIAVQLAGGERLDARKNRLLADFGAQAGLALSNAQMTAELRARLDDVSAQAAALRTSRGRIVAAQDATRRRLERDIHDGAQQHLVALAVTLRLARQLAEKDPAKTSGLVDDLLIQTGAALETLRDLARGIFPPVLRDRGLAPALRAHAQKVAPDAHVLISQALTSQRFSPEIEAGVYFCCVEALQNCARHAPGAPVTLLLELDGDTLAFAVRDTGPGFDPQPAPQGSGCQSMADRMAALDGTLVINSRPGDGTVVKGAVPLASAPVPVLVPERGPVTSPVDPS